MLTFVSEALEPPPGPLGEAFTSAIAPRTNTGQRGLDISPPSHLDASLLMTALVGFVPATDERLLGTIRAIERELLDDGLVMRYRTEQADDGLPAGEGVFMACSFWLADNYALCGRVAEARAVFERLLSLRNDVDLLTEEYDPVRKRQLGNLAQTFLHVGLVNTAYDLTPRQAAPASEPKKG